MTAMKSITTLSCNRASLGRSICEVGKVLSCTLAEHTYRCGRQRPEELKLYFIERSSFILDLSVVCLNGAS